MLKVPFLGVYGYAGVIAHVFMASGSDVEEGGLSAVGIAHKGHANHMVALLCDMCQSLVQTFFFLHVSGEGLQMLVVHEGLLGLFLSDDFNLLRFLAAQRNLVADDFIFDGVFERRIQDNFDFLALDKAHLYQAFTKTAMTVNAHNHRFFACL